MASYLNYEKNEALYLSDIYEKTRARAGWRWGLSDVSIMSLPRWLIMMTASSIRSVEGGGEICTISCPPSDRVRTETSLLSFHVLPFIMEVFEIKQIYPTVCCVFLFLVCSCLEFVCVRPDQDLRLTIVYCEIPLPGKTGVLKLWEILTSVITLSPRIMTICQYTLIFTASSVLIMADWLKFKICYFAVCSWCWQAQFWTQCFYSVVCSFVLFGFK